MSGRVAALFASAVVAAGVNFVGVFFFFRPIAEADRGLPLTRVPSSCSGSKRDHHCNDS